jgi:hypothetical protein|tara:strand:+ start:113 stop:361 length:249 start_codon:yes stop_codon:yes gene_type:complete
MTMPKERFYAIRNAREFLVELMDPKKTPRVPKEIRLKAYYTIKHFPGEYHMEEARKLAPEIFGDWDTGLVDSVPYEHNRGRS